LISWNKERFTGLAMHQTYAVPIFFQKRLSSFGALALVLVILAALFFSLWLLGAIVGSLRNQWQSRDARGRLAAVPSPRSSLTASGK
jgi:hypothetical protein